MHEYNEDFYRYTNVGAVSSAKRVIPAIQRYFDVTSLADFGCGQGAWLAVWQQYGVKDVTGIDGNYVDQESILVAPDRFIAHDLSLPIDLGRRFDLVQSLEVAEHLPEGVAEQFVDTLVRHGDIVLFSAAPPGQGGENHINERPYEYWRDKFDKRGYQLIDIVRPSVATSPDVEVWYRYNTFVYIRTSVLERQFPELLIHAVPKTAAIRDISPLAYQVRKRIVRAIPEPVANAIAGTRAAFFARFRRSRH